MITERQKMQIKRQIARKYGLNENYLIITIDNVDENILNKAHYTEINVTFEHMKISFKGKERFAILNNDSRRIPLFIEIEEEKEGVNNENDEHKEQD